MDIINPSFPQLYASVLVKDSLTVSKGKSLLEKALKEDSYHLPAVYLLCELYEQVCVGWADVLVACCFNSVMVF